MHRLLEEALGDSLLDEVVELTRDLIRADTTNPPGNETRGAEVLDAYLRGNGVQAEIVARDPARANLIARVRGRGERPVAGARRPHRRRLRGSRRTGASGRSPASCATVICGAAARST